MGFRREWLDDKSKIVGKGQYSRDVYLPDELLEKV